MNLTEDSERLNDCIPESTIIKRLLIEIGQLKSYIIEVEDTNVKLIKDFKAHLSSFNQEMSELRSFKETHAGIKKEIVKDDIITNLKTHHKNAISNIKTLLKQAIECRDRALFKMYYYKSLLDKNNISYE